ncbi:hypothetical protein ZHAS_00004110 [Anopheles sinensis]|uniref:Uncharacterized protein n=1 Tax=Anopheles sinensis TaxID=74873 RepID=A0A084VG43_ANOSI|nr:hypothetical protein ZHAS_00004110 [Anopheles sinensis]
MFDNSGLKLLGARRWRHQQQQRARFASRKTQTREPKCSHLFEISARDDFSTLREVSRERSLLCAGAGSSYGRFQRCAQRPRRPSDQDGPRDGFVSDRWIKPLERTAVTENSASVNLAEWLIGHGSCVRYAWVKHFPLRRKMTHEKVCSSSSW